MPKGDENDPTRPPEFYDGTFDFLERCGLQTLNCGGAAPAFDKPLDAGIMDHETGSSPSLPRQIGSSGLISE